MEDVRREQQYQREREANFRDLSEVTNSRAVWYSIAQIIVIVATCTWQLRHLKVCCLRASSTRTCADTSLSVSSRRGRCNNAHLAIVLYGVACTFLAFWEYDGSTAGLAISNGTAIIMLSNCYLNTNPRVVLSLRAPSCRIAPGLASGRYHEFSVSRCCHCRWRVW